jgi:hypothetical protein
MTETLLSGAKYDNHWRNLEKINALERSFLPIDRQLDDPEALEARQDNWKLTLVSDKAGQLISASSVLFGSDRYTFSQSSESGLIAQTNTANRQLSPQLHNLVMRAVEEEVVWQRVALA